MAEHQSTSGVRAEPVFIRDPSALESLSSVLTGVSSYVANTLPTSFSMPSRGFTSPSTQTFPGTTHTSPYHYPVPPGHTNALLGQDNVCVLTNGDVVHFSAFDWIDCVSSLKHKASRRFCLLLGYNDGFQIWDITHPDNIHEIISVRNPENEVSFIKVLPTPRIPAGKSDLFEQQRPLVAIISSNKAEEGVLNPKKVQIYSLTTHQVIKTLDFGEGPEYNVSALDANERSLVVALSAPGEGTRLFLLNQLNLLPLHPKQATLNDAAQSGVFVLGTRLLAYVTSSEAPVENSDSKHGEHDTEAGGGYQDLAKGVAKEVFGGVKMLGGLAHMTISSYLSGGNAAGAGAVSSSPPGATGMSKTPNRHARRTSASIDQDRTASHTQNRRRHEDGSHKKEAVGTIIVRDISLPNMPIVAHFKPHDHPISGCKFSPSGRLLLTVSRHGNVFHVHEIRPSTGPGMRHVYKLARGITHASVEDIVFNEFETWVAVTTSRGTTHLYAINPFGGSPDVGAHMYTGVVNWSATAIEFPTNLNALCRIKQRHHVPEVILSSSHYADYNDLPSPNLSDKRRASLHRQNSQDSISSSGTGTSDQSGQGHLSRSQLHLAGMGRQRSSLAAYFVPSSTIFASDPGMVALSPGEDENTPDSPFPLSNGERGRRDSSTTHAHSGTIVMNRSKAPPISTAARLQSTASHLWHTLSPPAAAVVQHAAHGLASLPGLVVESSRRGPVATVRSRTMSWTGASLAKQNHTRHEGMANGHTNSAVNESDTPLSVQQQLASQSALPEPERGPSFSDIYVFNPLGMLTLHRCWITSVPSKKTYNGRVVETFDLVLAPEDVAEWTLNRSGDWSTVKKPLAVAPPKAAQPSLVKPKKSSHAAGSGNRWLAQGEIATYDTGIGSGWKGQYPLLQQTITGQNGQNSTVTLTQPQHLLWKSPQFSFQIYTAPLEAVQQDFAVGKLPATRTLNLRRGVTVVAGDDNQTSGGPNRGGKPWISGLAVSADGGGVRGYGRVESPEGEAEDLSENLSSAMKSYLETHSSLPINQSRMSPSVGSVSPSSYRAATLSFEDAYLISLGNGSGSPKPTFFGAANLHQHPHQHSQPSFLSTPPAEQNPKTRSGFQPGSNPSAPGARDSMTSFSITPASMSFGDAVGPLDNSVPSIRANPSPKTGFSASASSASSGRPPHPPHAAGFNSVGQSPSQGSPNLISLGRTSTSGHGAMGQSTLMMFSPDGDNEVDMPGSASIMVTGGPRNPQSSLRSTATGGQNMSSTTLPADGVFHLDDDDFYDEDDMAAFAGAKHGQGGGHAVPHIQHGSILGRGRSILGDEPETILEDEYEDRSLI